MPQFNKALIVPIITLIAMLVKQSAHIEIPNPLIDQTADAVMAVVTLAGLFMHPHATYTPPPAPPYQPDDRR
jgi:hypothetical protein